MKNRNRMCLPPLVQKERCVDRAITIKAIRFSSVMRRRPAVRTLHRFSVRKDGGIGEVYVSYYGRVVLAFFRIQFPPSSDPVDLNVTQDRELTRLTSQARPLLATGRRPDVSRLTKFSFLLLDFITVHFHYNSLSITPIPLLALYQERFQYCLVEIRQ